MRRPDEIRREIAELETELAESVMESEWKLLCKSDVEGDSIGFFNLKKARTILKYLYNGYRLQLRHEALGVYEVYMNPQRNRILLNAESESVNEESIMGFIVWHSGDWYVFNSEL